MASVRKRKWIHNGKEGEAWVVNYTDQGGKRRQKAFDRKKEADAYRTEIEAEIKQGVHTALNESVKVSEAVRAFCVDCQKRVTAGTMTNGGFKSYRWKLEKYAVQKFGTRKVSTITAEEVQDWVDELLRTLSPTSVTGIYVAFGVLLSFAVRRRWVRRNILRDMPCKLPARPKRKAVPTKADILALMHAASTMERGENLLTFVNRLVVVACGVFGGFRPGETFGLQWEDVDWQKGVIHVRHSHTKMDGLKAPKTEAGYRDVPITAPIDRALRQCARYWTIRRLAEGPGFGSDHPKAIFSRIARMWEGEFIAVRPEDLKGFVILTKVGKPMTATASATTFWSRLMKAAGLQTEDGKNRFTPHALRHAAASLLIEAGLDDMNLKRFIGHASIQTTKDIYGHLFPTDERMVATTAAIARDLDATTERQTSVRHPLQ
jgi:integrase